MKIRRNGIYKTIDSSEFGIYQKAGFEKVLDNGQKVKDEPLPELEPIVEKEAVIENPEEELPKLEKEEVEVEELEEKPVKPQQQGNGKNNNKNAKNNK